ncbi:MAG: hypothetical protein GX260_04835 [Tissierellia bacterium]|jgi:hypothetical protein|nr:hypothetical protein [Bacillota bacterium]NLL23087.1 hypothetical protein [Tissierellia bacterium]
MKDCPLCQIPVLKIEKGTKENPGFSFQLNLGWMVPLFIAVMIIKTIAKAVDKRTK